MGSLGFVLLHGGRLGAWSWDAVADRLRAAGHPVVQPSFTGIGECAALATPDVGLATNIADAVSAIEASGLPRFVVVGHSYAGMVLPTVLANLGDRVDTAVYFDAIVPEVGDSAASLIGPGVAAHLHALAAGNPSGPGWLVPTDPDPMAQLAIGTGSDAVAFSSRVTHQPLATYVDASTVSAFDWPGRKVFVRCTQNSIVPDAVPARVRDRPDWTYLEIDAPHNAMLADPDLTATTLLTLLTEPS